MPRHRRRDAMKAVLWHAWPCAAGCGLLVPWVAPHVGGRTGYLLSLASHWQWLFAALLLAGTLPAIPARRFTVLLWLLLLPLPWVTASPRLTASSAQPVLRVAVANVQKQAGNAARLRQWLQATPADVVVVVEATPEVAALAGGWSDYPHRILEPRPHAFGAALLSRYPLSRRRSHDFGDGHALIDAVLALPSGPVRVIGFHPLPPMRSDAEMRLRDKLRTLTDAAWAEGLPTVIAGDFNATPWSPALRQLDARQWRRTGSLQPTWPTPWWGTMGVPIDHVLASTHWQLAGSMRGPENGADHFPIRVDLALPTQPEAGR